MKSASVQLLQEAVTSTEPHCFGLVCNNPQLVSDRISYDMHDNVPKPGIQTLLGRHSACCVTDLHTQLVIAAIGVRGLPCMG